MLLLTNTDLRLHYIFGRVEPGKRIGRNVNLGICDSTVHYSSVRYWFTCSSEGKNVIYLQNYTKMRFIYFFFLFIKSYTFALRFLTLLILGSFVQKSRCKGKSNQNERRSKHSTDYDVYADILVTLTRP